jgi:AbiV family abortive infection protein
MTLNTAKFQKSIAACIANGERLLEEANWAMHRASTGLALAMLAQEECAKAFVLALVRDGILPWTNDVRRSLSVHVCKHLVAIAMEWLLEVNESRLNEDKLNPTADMPNYLPPDVATAMNIYRHELIERIGKRHPDHYTEWKGRARKLADGKRDRRKQSALYVGLNDDGGLSSEPCESQQAYEEELVRTKALLEFANDVDRHVIFAFHEYKMFTEIFAAMFKDHGPDSVPSAPEELYDSGIPGVVFVKQTITCATVIGEDNEEPADSSPPVLSDPFNF